MHVPFRNRVCKLQQAVGQRAFAMVNMCDDAEISDSIHLLFLWTLQNSAQIYSIFRTLIEIGMIRRKILT
jgi:hypothetical protein